MYLSNFRLDEAGNLSISFWSISISYVKSGHVTGGIMVSLIDLFIYFNIKTIPINNIR